MPAQEYSFSLHEKEKTIWQPKRFINVTPSSILGIFELHVEKRAAWANEEPQLKKIEIKEKQSNETKNCLIKKGTENVDTTLILNNYQFVLIRRYRVVPVAIRSNARPKSKDSRVSDFWDAVLK